MIFNSLLFGLFFITTFAFYFFTGGTKTRRLSVLTFFNLIFYASWGLKLVPLLLGMGVAVYFVTRHIHRTAKSEVKKRKLWLSLGVLSNIGILIFFKYFDFLIGSGASVLQLFGVEASAPHLGLIVPLGLSFYTLQLLSYMFDVYYGAYEPRESLLEFIASLTFFPHLLAGPIVRTSFLVPQFTSLKDPKEGDFTLAGVLIAVGLSKKILADLLSPLVSNIFSGTQEVSLIEGWTGAIAFAAQMYGDFSGYTDMATGLAMLLGFQLPPNFHLPYLSTSPMDFWRRWHISMSTWFRDYVFLPLSTGALKKHIYFNFFFVLLLAGIWHGAGLNYLAFGVYHGGLLAGTLWLMHRLGKNVIPSKTLQIVITFYLIVLGQVIFRSETLDSFLNVIRGMHFFGPPSAFTSQQIFSFSAAVVTLVFSHLMDYCVLYHKKIFEHWPLYVGFATGAYVLAMILNHRAPFIYFQF